MRLLEEWLSGRSMPRPRCFGIWVAACVPPVERRRGQGLQNLEAQPIRPSFLQSARLHRSPKPYQIPCNPKVRKATGMPLNSKPKTHNPEPQTLKLQTRNPPVAGATWSGLLRSTSAAAPGRLEAARKAGLCFNIGALIIRIGCLEGLF